MRFLLAAALFLFPGIVHAEVSNTVCRANGTEMCSKTFHGGGSCDNKDQTPILEEPWETRSIKIVGVEFVVELRKPGPLTALFVKAPTSYAFAGNSYAPDVMKKLLGEGTTPNPFFPPGHFFAFPGKTGKDDPHVDLHVQCTGGRAYGAIMTIYYTLD